MKITTIRIMGGKCPWCAQQNSSLVKQKSFTRKLSATKRKNVRDVLLPIAIAKSYERDSFVRKSSFRLNFGKYEIQFSENK